MKLISRIKFHSRFLVAVLALFLFFKPHEVICQSQNNSDIVSKKNKESKTKKKKKKKRRKKVRLPDIDLSHWKVTLPVTNDNGKPYEIEPPEILNFA
ncbi:MAG: hypothetical protein AAF688_05135, partial [Bacteroidota bacterium]